MKLKQVKTEQNRNEIPDEIKTGFANQQVQSKQIKIGMRYPMKLKQDLQISKYGQNRTKKE